MHTENQRKMLNLSTAYRTAKGLLLVSCPMPPNAPLPLLLTHALDFISMGSQQKNKKLSTFDHKRTLYRVVIYFMPILVNFYK